MRCPFNKGDVIKVTKYRNHLINYKEEEVKVIGTLIDIWKSGIPVDTKKVIKYFGKQGIVNKLYNEADMDRLLIEVSENHYILFPYNLNFFNFYKINY